MKLRAYVFGKSRKHLKCRVLSPQPDNLIRSIWNDIGFSTHQIQFSTSSVVAHLILSLYAKYREGGPRAGQNSTIALKFCQDSITVYEILEQWQFSKNLNIVPSISLGSSTHQVPHSTPLVLLVLLH